MTNQIKNEWYKLWHFSFFYIMIAFFAIMGIVYGYIRLAPSPEVYNIGLEAAVSDTSFLFLITIFASLFIGMDFSNRTIQNEIKLGCSRLSVILCRASVILPASALLHILYVLCVIVGVGVKKGFDMRLSPLSITAWILVCAFEVMAVQSFVLLFSFLLRKALQAIVYSVCFTFITCNILRNFMDQDFFKKSCFYLADNSNFPTLLTAFLVSAAVMVIVFTVSGCFFRKAEVK